MSSGFAWLITTTVLMHKNGGGTDFKMGLPPQPPLIVDYLAPTLLFKRKCKFFFFTF
jgi:hypothetical protein